MTKIFMEKSKIEKFIVVPAFTASIIISLGSYPDPQPIDAPQKEYRLETQDFRNYNVYGVSSTSGVVRN